MQMALVLDEWLDSIDLMLDAKEQFNLSSRLQPERKKERMEE